MFENIKFGDLYKTRDNRKAVFVGKCEDKDWYLFHVEGEGMSFMYTEDGKILGNHEIDTEWDEDIVSKL